LRFPWITARLEKGGLAMQRATLIVNTRLRSGEKAFFRALDLRKAELVRDRLEGLDQLMGSYPEGHDMRARMEALNLRRALVEVEEDIRLLTDAIRHPRGTSAPLGV
jgi:hypothetical protein